MKFLIDIVIVVCVFFKKDKYFKMFIYWKFREIRIIWVGILYCLIIMMIIIRVYVSWMLIVKERYNLVFKKLGCVVRFL